MTDDTGNTAHGTAKPAEYLTTPLPSNFPSPGQSTAQTCVHQWQVVSKSLFCGGWAGERPPGVPFEISKRCAKCDRWHYSVEFEPLPPLTSGPRP